jgi:pimeloyl-ACP methyl ester carboxylesterase
MTNHHQLTARRALLAGLIVLACGVTACGVGQATDKDKIAKRTSTYLRALAHGDAATACSQLSQRAQGDHCRRTLARRPPQLTAQALDAAADAPLDITVRGSTAISGLGKPASARLRLIKTGNAWRIDSGYAVPVPAPTLIDGGRMVDIGGGRGLYLKCVGSGRPTILLEAGFGGTSDVWLDVQRPLGRTGRTCAYDRAGLGHSTALPGVHDATDETRDLQRLLDTAHLPPPYVLVGHSYGGLLVRLFAHAHPNEVAGVVLVDAMGRDQTRRQLALWPHTVVPAVRRDVAKPVRDGTNRAAGETLDRRVHSLGATPLAVVTAGRHDTEWGPAPGRLRHGLDRLWTAMQDQLATLSSNHVHVVARNSDHFIQRFEGQPAVVLRAVTAVVDAAQTHMPLPPCARLFIGPDVACR